MKLAKEKRNIENKAAATAKELRAEDKKAAIKANGIKRKSVKDESDSDVPLKAKRKPVVKKTNGVKQESSDDDVPLAKKAKAISKNAATVKWKAADNNKAVVKGKAKAAKEDTPAGAETAEDEEYKWWENQAETDGTQKWTTLEHNGVLFPPAYEPLPKNVKLKYDGAPVTLPLAAEEVAGFFGHMLNSTHATNPTFTANFFKDFQRILKESGGAKDTTGKVCCVLLW